MARLLFVVGMSAAPVVLLAMTAFAQTVISGCGGGWGAGPLPASGQALDYVGTTTFIDPAIGGDVAANEFTLRIAGLQSTGPVDLGGGFYIVSFVGGVFEILRDANHNATFGPNPPNATVPSTFIDGATYLSGSILIYNLIYDTNSGAGAWEAFLDLQGGEALPTFEGFQVLGWKLGGVFDAPNADVPSGYWLAGNFELLPEFSSARRAATLLAGTDCWQTVSVRGNTWAAVKRLYRE